MSVENLKLNWRRRKIPILSHSPAAVYKTNSSEYNICFITSWKWPSLNFLQWVNTFPIFQQQLVLKSSINVEKKRLDTSQFNQRGSYTKLLHRSWKFHQLCILSSTIQWCYPKYWKSLCHFDPCLSMLIFIKIINFIESKIELSKFCFYGTTIFNILDNTTELWMTKYIIGEIFSSGGANLYT